MVFIGMAGGGAVVVLLKLHFISFPYFSLCFRLFLKNSSPIFTLLLTLFWSPLNPHWLLNAPLLGSSELFLWDQLPAAARNQVGESHETQPKQ